MKKIIGFVLLIIAFSTCNKKPDSIPPPVETYLGDTTITYPKGLIPATLPELLSIPVVDTSVLPELGRNTNTLVDPAYDLNNNPPGLPPAMHQSWNNCTAWAVGYGMMGYLYGIIGGYTSYNSTDRIFSPAYIYNQSNGGADNGMKIISALNLVKQQGCCKWVDMPENTTSPFVLPSSTVVAKAAINKITDFYRVESIDIYLLKFILNVRKYPVPFAAFVDFNFDHIGSSSWEIRQGNRMVWKSYSLSFRTPELHAMLIVGYDDAIRAFKVLNSWGSNWGPSHDGYCWIDYDHFKAIVQKQPANGFENPEIFVGLLKRPTLTTEQPISTTSTTAVTGGNITSDGNNTILSRGVCWSTASNPTIANNTTLNGTGPGAFTSNISGLTAGLTYNIRAYATTGAGTSYGNQVSFTTSTNGGNTVTDIDGNVYNTVQIGTQTWMVENLRTSKYRDGTPIPEVNNYLWSGLTSGAWNIYNNDINNNLIYGKLYNWYAVDDPRGLAPTGWHIPSDADWNKLVKYLDANADTTCFLCPQSTIAGGSLKESGTVHWYSPNTGASNISGFTALPGGTRTGGGNWVSFSYHGYWWTSTGSSGSYASHRNLYFGDASVHRSTEHKGFGFSIRCIKD